MTTNWMAPLITNQNLRVKKNKKVITKLKLNVKGNFIQKLMKNKSKKRNYKINKNVEFF